LKQLSDATRFMRHKVGAHKVRQITIVKLFTGYSNLIVYTLFFL